MKTVECNNRRRLLYFIQHCTGKAKSFIEYCLLLEPYRRYAKEKQILYVNYGKKNAIARSHIKYLLEGHPSEKDDAKIVIELAQKLEKCNTTLKHQHHFRS